MYIERSPYKSAKDVVEARITESKVISELIPNT